MIPAVLTTLLKLNSNLVCELPNAIRSCPLADLILRLTLHELTRTIEPWY